VRRNNFILFLLDSRNAYFKGKTGVLEVRRKITRRSWQDKYEKLDVTLFKDAHDIFRHIITMNEDILGVYF